MSIHTTRHTSVLTQGTEMSELLFETYGVPSVSYGIVRRRRFYISLCTLTHSPHQDSLFSMYQNNIDTGLCVSSSYFATHFLPVVASQCLHSHIRRYASFADAKYAGLTFSH